MSLVGSLEDLALGDILQIVSLSRKSGLLLLRSNSGEGRIVLSDGLVRAAYVKGESEDLRGLLVSGGFVACEDFDRCERFAAESKRPLDEVISERTSQTSERLDSLRREHLERAVLSMFRWRTGEFAFEVREEIAERDRELMILIGVNAQYLTMEATRLGDEGAAIEGGDPKANDSAAADDASGEDEFVFSGEDADQDEADPAPDEAPYAPGDLAETLEGAVAADDEAYAELLDASTDEADPVVRFDALATEALALAAAHQVEVPEILTPLAEPDTDPAISEPGEAPRGERVMQPVSTPDLEPLGGTSLSARAPVPDAPATIPRVSAVAIHPELSTLEWLKASLCDHFLRIHIFQHVDRGIDRIRQYLARSERPLVLLSTHLAGEMRDGDAGLQALIQRLKALSPEMQVVLLHRDGSPLPTSSGADGELSCPSTYELADRRRWSRLEGAVQDLRSEIAPWISRCTARAGSRSATDPGPASASGPDPRLARLRQVSERLRDPSSRGDVLSLVLEFAAETFNRVAIFMLRDDQAVGIAQVGLERAGGPDDDALQHIDFAADKPAWFREVVATRQAVCSAPNHSSNRRLTELLGVGVPTEAYVAPIESGGRVAALLYGDNLPGEAPIADTTALEIVLHEAGLALDRALLERALADPADDIEGGESL